MLECKLNRSPEEVSTKRSKRGKVLFPLARYRAGAENCHLNFTQGTVTAWRRKWKWD